MSNFNSCNINNSQPKIYKQIWSLGDKHLVIIDKSIIERLGITTENNSIVFLEQDITPDHTTIVMRIKEFGKDVDQQGVGSSLNNQNVN